MLRERSSCNRTRVPRANAIRNASTRIRTPNRIRIRRKPPEYRRLAPPTIPPPHSHLPSPAGVTAASLPAPRVMAAAVFFQFRASCGVAGGVRRGEKAKCQVLDTILRHSRHVVGCFPRSGACGTAQDGQPKRERSEGLVRVHPAASRRSRQVRGHLPCTRDQYRPQCRL